MPTPVTKTTDSLDMLLDILGSSGKADRETAPVVKTPAPALAKAPQPNSGSLAKAFADDQGPAASVAGSSDEPTVGSPALPANNNADLGDLADLLGTAGSGTRSLPPRQPKPKPVYKDPPVRQPRSSAPSGRPVSSGGG